MKKILLICVLMLLLLVLPGCVTILGHGHGGFRGYRHHHVWHGPRGRGCAIVSHLLIGH
ncbi:MAG: hypothetical protein JSU70_19955 [Phycisphaerales bacterium]|nr:MAG: hypothetical protein JSU70_19955 [Phycisphaerales bacterium]